MSVKRKEKQEKRKKRLKRANNAPTKPRALSTRISGDAYYGNAVAMVEDIKLMQSAWEKNYGELAADFVPPI
jgi:hypothetical protein